MRRNLAAESVRRRTPPLWALLFGMLAALVVVSACSDDGSKGSNAAGGSESYPEGDAKIAVDMLDTGLIKGTATVEAKGDWRVADISVSAEAPGGVKWGVLEFPEGVGSASASEFFEVQVQELSRGEQLEITATATFEDADGKTVERQAIDHWPP